MNIEYFKNLNYDALKQRLIELQDFGDNALHEYEDDIYENCINFIKNNYSSYLRRIIDEESGRLKEISNFIYFLYL